jgi:hypothetical protein
MTYKIEQFVSGRWYKVGSTFASYEEASNKVSQYMLQGQQYPKPRQSKRVPEFRIVRI